MLRTRCLRGLMVVVQKGVVLRRSATTLGLCHVDAEGGAPQRLRSHGRTVAFPTTTSGMSGWQITSRVPRTSMLSPFIEARGTGLISTAGTTRLARSGVELR